MNDIERLTLDLIGENVNSPDVFVEGSSAFDQLRDSVNNAITELCLTTGCATKTFQIVTLAGRQFYPLNRTADHFLYPVEVVDRTNNRKLVQTSVRELDQTDWRWMQQIGPATHYMQIGQQWLGIWRIPTVSGLVLDVRAAMVPKAYTEGDDAPRIKEQFQRAASYYAASEYYASRGDAGRATEAMLAYQDMADIMRLSPEHQMRVRQQVQTNGAYASRQPY